MNTALFYAPLVGTCFFTIGLIGIIENVMWHPKDTTLRISITFGSLGLGVAELLVRWATSF